MVSPVSSARAAGGLTRTIGGGAVVGNGANDGDTAAEAGAGLGSPNTLVAAAAGAAVAGGVAANSMVGGGTYGIVVDVDVDVAVVGGMVGGSVWAERPGVPQAASRTTTTVWGAAARRAGLSVHDV